MAVDSSLKVPYNIPGGNQWQWVSIDQRMAQERILFLNRPLNTTLANSLMSAMLYLESEDQSKPIYLYINSLGDPVLAGMDETLGMMSIRACLSVYDTIQYIKSEIVTICLGQAVGMAALILSSGTKGKRFSLPHANIALTQFSVATQGQATDIQVNAEEVLQKKNILFDIFSQNTGQTAEKISKDSERIFYMTPQEAQEYGLIDRVLESTKNLSSSI
ncbi:ATP-dependent Clp protease proteolytic subunit [Dolichospermum sp. LEGE 00240]|jgi:ATP-dependent Clp protease, protease subunit|uniref:ATP-dependent Clp protease proteolytic subunit n=1 Tax=Dolichospermum sp. LEGE 00240 TaxID=1828603 RepID=UPI0018818C70|nr:ATP-dependent Clp protease proteolytic subunit [Dolichospermum sp. LEGE 00240]MDM3843507.1 ATP-dependent Clp protease proteolytic subunit [Aphanizomenon gracile PMC638.10]MDM3848916.1 ATP-dependent Clp protease proteolytic subunit [Aphanizomenon gracile PMC627.10]MDM3856303.1 ATP-dependent Clp protease proteolytic subunit [Aphanizomenon gracile PMC649.10]MDM3858479.1 ATP-dependent Clp protease proteolytic subunit [Aphanizomenon gracile PMC644.10]MBE9247770.1 ATP-dependent Clp protease prote